MRNTPPPPTYTAYRRWMTHAPKRGDITTVKRYGDRVLLCDGRMLTYIPYGALPETLLASETESRQWGTETPTRYDPATVLASLADSAPIYMTNTLHRLAGPKSLCHLLVTADGAPAASVDADQMALIVSDVETPDLRYRVNADHCVSVWRGDGEDALLLGALMSMRDVTHDHWYLAQRIIGLPAPTPPPTPETPPEPTEPTEAPPLADLTEPLIITYRKTVGCYGSDQWGRNWATWSGPAVACAICGATITGGWSLALSDAHVCGAHVETRPPTA